MPAQTRHNQVHTDSMNTIPSRCRSPLKFFLLVFALSLPFLLAGPLVRYQLVPGVPVTALIVVFCPATAAIILVYRESKTAGVRDLLKRSFDYKRIKAKIWYAPILLLMPGVTILSCGWMRWIGVPLPIPQAPVVATLAMSLAIFILALGEELGWSGYAIDPMQDRWVRSLPAFSWGWCGPYGTSCRWCRFTARQHGSPGGVSVQWRLGFSWYGSTTTQARASSLWLSFTPPSTSPGNCFRSTVRTLTRVSTA